MGANANVAIGGVVGATNWFEHLDLHGTPRLDLSVHAPGTYINVDFVRELDPALELATETASGPAVVIHAVRRAQSLFDRQSMNETWADPAECLLDLHEMGFTQQATEWLEAVK